MREHGVCGETVLGGFQMGLQWPLDARHLWCLNLVVMGGCVGVCPPRSFSHLWGVLDLESRWVVVQITSPPPAPVVARQPALRG